jgi:fructokinase
VSDPRAPAIGIDLGGTKLAGVVLTAAGAPLAERRRPTPKLDYDGIVAAVATLVRQLEEDAGLSGLRVGVGTPGSLSPTTGLLRNANTTSLNGRPLREDLEAAIGREIRIANDADCLAASEAADGAGAGARGLFAAILGTGAGGGLAWRGELVQGPNAIAGEWGHNPLPWPDPEVELPGAECWCGKRGCIETWPSGPGLVADSRRRGGDADKTETVVAEAGAGNATAEAALAAYEDRLARALAGIINVLDPETVVLGGGLSRIERLYRNVPARWDRYVFSDAVTTRLLPARHGAASGVRGAARLWTL